MTTYNTGNAVGSTAVKDLYDNTENLDQAVNDRSTDKWTDRLGNERLTWEGMTRLSNLGAAVEAAERAEEAADRAAAYDNLLVYLSYDSPSDKRMVDDLTQPIGTLGRVTSDADPNKNGDYVMTATGWAWSDVQPATTASMNELKEDVQTSIAEVGVAFYTPGIYRMPLTVYGSQPSVETADLDRNLVDGPDVMQAVALPSIVRMPLSKYREVPGFSTVDLDGHKVVPDGDSDLSGDPVEVAACVVDGAIVYIAPRTESGTYPLMSAVGSVRTQLAPNARDLRSDGDAVMFTAGDGRPGGYRVSAAGGQVQPVLTDTRTIVCWGDSLSNNTYEPALAALMPDRTVLARGISSQVSREIVARQGGMPATVVLPSAQIPASGPVVLTSISTPFLTSLASPTATLSMTGKLAGVAGTMTKSSTDTYTFERTSSGSVVSCPDGTPFVPDDGEANRGNLMIWWAGTNDVTYGWTSADLVSHVTAAWEYLSPYAKIAIVCGPHNRNTAPSGSAQHTLVLQMEADLAAAAATNGWIFANTRRYLIDLGLADAGITPTSGDLDDIANDIVPRSLRVDFVHLTAVGYQLIANFLKNIITTNGL